MIKTLFASLSTFAYVGCIAVCCMGNDYPAKAQGMADYYEREEARKEMHYQSSQIQQLRDEVKQLQFDQAFRELYPID